MIVMQAVLFAPAQTRDSPSAIFTRLRRGAISTLILALLTSMLTACGGGDDLTPTTTPTPTPTTTPTLTPTTTTAPIPPSLSLMAGNMGGAGNADATGAAASFYHPLGVATDNTGNIYVTDYNNSTIRKITPAGVVTTFAGTAGLSGSADGTGVAARFNTPAGITTDSADNVYVADPSNHTIRKITPAGVVTMFAGSAGLSGSTDGTGAAARFNFPEGIATDSADNVYIADSGNNTIRKITPAGVVTTLAGSPGFSGSADGTGAATSFNNPTGIATDDRGNVYVADTDNNTIRKITPAGVVTTIVGVVGQIGFLPGALPGVIASPRHVAVSDTSLYITMINGVAVVRDLP